MEDRKKDHIEMALQSQIAAMNIDPRFDYEPVLSAHPTSGALACTFLGCELGAPLWISSMTGGTSRAKFINQNLARACNEFKLGMGLGSCRPLLEKESIIPDFDLRHIIGPGLPFYANLGIAQLEYLVVNKQLNKIVSMVEMLQADGLIIHINPIQEWLQPEGDRILNNPIETIQRLLEETDLRIIVKEVGQGMGPESISRLLELPLAAIEFGAFGGTNFAKLELMRNNGKTRNFYEPLSMVGHSALEMVMFANEASEKVNVRCKELIISGGISSFLDGYYLVRQSKLNAVYGQASAFLKYANVSYEALHDFISSQIHGLQLATAYLKLKHRNY